MPEEADSSESWLQGDEILDAGPTEYFENAHELSPEMPPEMPPEKSLLGRAWVVFLQAEQELFVHSQVVHVSGDIFVVGWFRGRSAELGGISVQGREGGDKQAFLLCVSPEGKARWAKSWGAEGDEQLVAIASGKDGVLYAVGTFTSKELVLGTERHSNRGSSDLFLVSFSAQGELLWSTRKGGEADEYATDILIDASGALYVAGFFKGFDAELFNPQARYNAKEFGLVSPTDFVSKLDAQGRFQWEIAFVTSFGLAERPLLAAPGFSLHQAFSALYMSNLCDGLWLPTSSPQGAGQSHRIDGMDTYLMKITTGGSAQWAVSFAGELGGVERLGALLADGEKVFLAGHYSGRLYTYDGLFVGQSSSQSGFVTAWDAKGSLLWSNTLDTAAQGSMILAGLAQDTRHTYVLGESLGPFSLPKYSSSLFSSQGKQAIFVAFLDAQGRWRGLRLLESDANLSVRGRLIAHSNGNLVFAGTTDASFLQWGTESFPVPTKSAGSSVGFLLSVVAP